MSTPPHNNHDDSQQSPDLRERGSNIDFRKLIAAAFVVFSMTMAIITDREPNLTPNESGQFTDGPLVGGQVVGITPEYILTQNAVDIQRTVDARLASLRPTPIPICNPTAGCEPASFFDFNGFAYIDSVKLNQPLDEITTDRPLEITITWIPKNLEDLPKDEQNAHTAADYQTVIIWEDAQGNKLAESRQTPQDGTDGSTPTSIWIPNQAVFDQHTLAFESSIDFEQNHALYIGIIDSNTNHWIPTQFGNTVPLDPNQLNTQE